MSDLAPHPTAADNKDRIPVLVTRPDASKPKVDQPVNAFELLAKLQAPVHGRGYDMAMHHMGISYQDKSTAIVIPTIGPINAKVVERLLMLLSPQNCKRAMCIIEHEEVAAAYNYAVKRIIEDPKNKFKYILTIESDNIVPIDCHIKLLKAIEQTGAAAVGALYFAKGFDTWFPMAFGDPSKGQFDCQPRDVYEASMKEQLMEVCGVAMGCTLFDTSIFRELEPPWFVTYQEDGTGGKQFGGASQDLYFSRRVREIGRRLFVHCGCLAGHIDNENTIW